MAFIQTNTSLLYITLSSTLLVILFLINDYKKTLKKKKKEFYFLDNQLVKENTLKEHYKFESIKLKTSEKEIEQKFVTLRVDVMLIDYTLREIFSDNLKRPLSIDLL